MVEGLCAWPGCKSAAEATLDGHTWCRTHFLDTAAKRFKEYDAYLHLGEPTQAERDAITKFLLELMRQAPKLIASAKSLTAAERERILAVSFSATELYKQAQREPREPRNLPILIFREEEAGGKQEPAIALNVSKLGACIATTRVSKAGETIWVQWPHNTQRAFARVVWAKRLAASQYLIGIEILDCENFWELEGTTPAAS